MNIPNFLTLLRILVTPFVVVAIVHSKFDVALVLFLAAGVSDLLDGYLARLFKSQTKLGVVLDPFADKILMISIFVTLTYMDMIPLWFAMILVTRDLLMILIYLMSKLFNLKSDIKAIFWGKLNTFLQLLLVSVVLISYGYWEMSSIIFSVLLLANLLTSFISAFKYLIIWMKNNKINAKL